MSLPFLASEPRHLATTLRLCGSVNPEGYHLALGDPKLEAAVNMVPLAMTAEAIAVWAIFAHRKGTR